MSDLTTAAQPAVSDLLQKDTDALFEELGARLITVRNDTSQGGNFALQGAESASDSLESGIDFGEVGRRFFNNLNLAAYNIICGSADGHEQVQQAASKGVDFATAAIAAMLVTHLGIMAALAAAVAAIIVKLFMKAGADTLCTTWKEQLPNTQPAAPTAAAKPS